MSDFLHNLRSGKDKRYERPRRNYDGTTHYRHGNLERKRRGPYQSQSGDNAYTTIAKVLPSVRTLLEAYAEDRKELIRLAQRQTDVMEAIAGYLKKLIFKDEDLTENIATKLEETAPAEAEQITEISKSKNQSTDHEDSLEMMKKMRKEGASYEKIIRYYY